MGTRRGNTLIGATVVSVVVGMVGLSFAAVPLYRLFCAATGFAGTPKIGPAVAPGGTGETIRVRFDANTNPGLPWTFGPVVTQVTLPLGEDQIAFYTARNRAKSATTGMAVYNVTPEKAAKYFHKTACFCFNQQTLEPGQTMEFPVSYWVDPAIRDVMEITLSYTFYRSAEDAATSGALAKAGPHVGAAPVTN